MKVAVISDIHSNHIALEEVYKYLIKEEVEQVVFLGDLLTDCPYPRKTIAMLSKFDKKFKTNYCKGNREDYILNLDTSLYDETNITSLNGSIYYTKMNLKKSDLEFIQKLKPAGILFFKDLPNIFYSHSLPHDSRRQLFPNSEDTNIYMLSNDCDYILCGHTHRSFTYEYASKTLINPGPFGLFGEGIKKARFVIMKSNEENKWDIEHHAMEYDYTELIEEFYESKIIKYGQVYSLAIIDSFKTGYNIASDLVTRAFSFKSNNDAITETAFIKAYIELENNK